MSKLNFISLCLVGIIISSYAEAQLRPFALRKKRAPVAQTVVLTAGASPWTVPAGVTTLTSVECWGGGGGTSSWYGDGYGGGGGGAYAKKLNVAVTPGSSINYSIGSGGTSPSNANGTDGGDTWFVSNATVLAKGGKAGLKDNTNWLGGAGGAAGSSIGDVVYSGGSGGNTQSGSGAGGGASATPTGAGGNGANATSGSPGNGGDAPGGGAGGTKGTNGAPPVAGTAGADNANGGGGGGGGGGRTGGSGGGAVGGRGGVPGGGAGAQGSNWNAVGVANSGGGAGQIIIKYMQ